MATFTASQLRPNLAAPHTGIQVTGGSLTLSATATASSILLMCRVPNGATILNYDMYVRQGGAAQVVNLGTSATPSGIASAFSLSTAVGNASISAMPIQLTGNYQTFWYGPAGDLLPVRISMSDDAIPQWVWVQAKLGITISATLIARLQLYYTMDGYLGHTTIR